MIIPIRCFTCGEILGDKWTPFIILTNKEKNKNNEDMKENDLNIETINIENNVGKTVEGKVLDTLNLNKMCCRRMILSNVHLISYVN
jgi:DNA-directed RNA polymerase subunit N (RpoN/RPB10)